MSTEEFPWLEYDDFFRFPPPHTWDEELVGVGGNLSPGMLISAYAQGVFPWFNEGEEILWWSLDPRFILYHDNLKVSKSMRKVLKKGGFRLTVDLAFEDVMRSCGAAPRPGQDGTWISKDMIAAYTGLHKLGFAHSVEVWQEDTLVGGLYGLSLGRAFFGESMFARASNASKTALIGLSSYLSEKDFAFIDCQQHTPHLGSLGACDVSRDRFLSELKSALKTPTLRGDWSVLFSDFPSSGLWNSLVPSAMEVNN